MFHHMDWSFMLVFLVLLPFVLLMTVLKENPNYKTSDAVLASILSAIVCFACFAFGVGVKVDDTEVRSGEVINKTRHHDSYQESYSCGTSDKPKTCYRTIYRVTWDVITNVGKRTVEVKESRFRSVYASSDPKRYQIIKIGEPAALEFNYRNYVKGSPESLFGSRIIEKKHEPLVKEYPVVVYDIYRAKRVLNIAGAGQNIKEWDDLLSEKHKAWGYKNKANVMLVFVKDPDFLVGMSFKNYWLQGKQNDLVVVVGLDENNNDMIWTDVFSWTENELLKLKLKDDLLALKSVEDKEAFLNVIDKHIVDFKYRDMEKDFKYLEVDIKPDSYWLILVIIFAIGASVIGIIWKQRHIDHHLPYTRYGSGSKTNFARVRHNKGR